MKQIKGYLLNKETGSGVSGKTVTFTKLDGSLVTSADTYAQSTSASTAGDGSFYGNFELSPGPINVTVTADVDEVKKRLHDERAEFGYQWASDISRIARGVGSGVVGGYMDELEVSTPSGHTIRIDTGAAIFNGNVFSIEMGHMDIAGTANTNPAIANRLDLVTLRQYNEDASGQDAGRQQVVVTLGSANNVAPATPTGADFVDLPLAVVSTAYNASGKTVSEDLREYTEGSDPSPAPELLTAVGLTTTYGSTPIYANSSPAVLNMGTITINDLDPDAVYDGFIEAIVPIRAKADNYGSISAPAIVNGYATFSVGSNTFIPSAYDGRRVGEWGFNTYNYLEVRQNMHFITPIVGVTGVTSYTFTTNMRFWGNGPFPSAVNVTASFAGSLSMNLKRR